MDFNFELYDGKSYADLMKDIVKNHKNKQSQIKILIEQLTEMVSEPGDAVVVVPLIKGYLDSDIKNDEALVKLAQIAQRASAPVAGSDSFSDKDLEMLFSDLHKNTAPLDEKEVKELPASV
jgi:hypothetical protein